MKIHNLATASALSLLLATSAMADGSNIMERTFEYKHGKTILEGFVARPATKDLIPRNAVIVVHEWMGLNDYAKNRARQLAGLGYIAFAADIYGKGVRPKTQEEAAKTATIYKDDRKLMRERIQAAVQEAQKMNDVNPKKIAVMGYCFGGTVALEAARAGMPIVGAVSFHGGLSTPNPEKTKDLKPKILVLHGADDPFVPADEVKAFEEEMKKSKADWQLVAYGGAVHAFTNPENKPKPGAGAAYNESADRRSWEAMKTFFDEVFAKIPVKN